ncbi:MAG: helix-turn-helix domain-containing protein [Coriobacteriia bacterium]|jgi:DNA-binding NarL/FixJ family response regulator|nr:helix-turn-helix domain-containing protein [Coriobacteriia bacterium]
MAARQLDATEIQIVLELIRQGLSDKVIAERMGVSRQAINDVRNGKTHKGAVR